MFTLGGRLWNNMQQRARAGGSRQKEDLAYSGVSHSFKGHNDFIDWAQTQAGYGKHGWALDKDILLRGNRVYSKEACVFVPVELNNFWLNADRGEHPVGVTWDRQYLKFRVKMKKNGLTTYIGLFDSPVDAFQAYKREKEFYAKQLACKWKEQIDPRVYTALMNFEVTIND